MKKRIIIPIIIIAVIALTSPALWKFLSGSTIGSLAYTANPKNYSVYLPENGEYVEYLVLTNNYNRTGSTLLLRKHALGGANYVIDYNGSIMQEKIYDGQVAMLGTGSRYEQTQVDQFLTQEFPSRFANSFLDLVNYTEVPIPRRYLTEQTYTVDKQFFLLSLKELGLADPLDDSDTMPLKYFTDHSLITQNDANINVGWWTRSYSANWQNYNAIGSSGALISGVGTDAKYAIRPALTLPSNTKITKKHLNDAIGSAYTITY